MEELEIKIEEGENGKTVTKGADAALTNYSNSMKMLMITDKHTFMINSISLHLEKSGIPVRISDIRTALMLDLKLPEYVFLQAEDFPDESVAMFEKIGLKCMEDGSKIILMGYDGTIDLLKKRVPSVYITEELHRPLDVSAACEIMHDIINPSKKRSSSIRKSVMAVDDSGSMLRTILSWLEGKYDVTLVNSAAKALILLHTKRPDIILLDYEMPVLSGAELFERIKTDPALVNIPVIFLTSKDDANTVKEVLNLGPAGYILKTDTGDQLISKIEQVLSKRG